MGIFDIINNTCNKINKKYDKNNEEKNSNYTEEELNLYGLSEIEKEQVRSNGYAPCDFETYN